MIKILLADDHAIIRNVLRQILEKPDDMQVVAEVSNGLEALKEALIHCPNVVVMDVSMPIMDGVEATKQICSVCAETHVLMVSTYNTPQPIRRSLEAGAFGYVLKDTVNHELVSAVRSVHQGNRYFSGQVAELAKYYIE